MIKSVVTAIVCAAGIAAGLTYGVDFLHAALSDDVSAAAQSAPLNSALVLEEVDAQRLQGRAGERTDIVDIIQAPQGAAAISTDVASMYLLSGAFARWNALLTLPVAPINQVAAANEEKNSHPQIARAADAGLRLPKPRPTRQSTANIMVASANPQELANVDHQPSAFSFLNKLLPFEAKSTLAFPAEATGRTAVYDIETHAVYLPNGEIIEAHSGLGDRMDDVHYVHEKSRGPTPPNVYALSLRETPFHGVQAIRLTPIGNGNMFGRAGILAHPYMLGPNGQSNGCVSVQNYPKFLQAFLNKEVDRLVVVPRAAIGTVNASGSSATRSEQQFQPI